MAHFSGIPANPLHALAYPLGGHYHVPHGLSNSLVLPEVIRFNQLDAGSLYAELAPLISQEPRLDIALSTLISDLDLPMRLRDVKVSAGDLPMLASDAMLQQRLLVNNPRPVTEADALAIYQKVY